MAPRSLRLVDTASGEVSDPEQQIVELEETIADLERDLRNKRRQITQLQRDKERERLAFEDRKLVEALFEFWRTRCQKPRSKLTPERFDAVRARLEDGYTPRQIGLAIAGAAFDPFRTKAKNGRLIAHLDLELICRDGRHLESFAMRAPRRGMI